MYTSFVNVHLLVFISTVETLNEKTDIVLKYKKERYYSNITEHKLRGNLSVTNPTVKDSFLLSS